jgi:hypothetical protein
LFGLIEFFTGSFFSKAHTAKFTSASYQACVSEVLTQTIQRLILIQDGARCRASIVMKVFCAAHADRITEYQLPRCSPEFNPIEY